MRKWFIAAAAAVCVLAALPASANPAIEQLSEMLVKPTAPIWWRLVTLLLLAVMCGFIQALIIRRFCQKRSLFSWTITFTVMTLILSGAPPSPDSIPWLGILIAFMAVTLLYSIMLSMLKVGKIRRWISYIGLSALVNAASYGLCALLLFALLDAPTMLLNDRALLHQVKGDLLIFNNYTDVHRLSMPENRFTYISTTVSPDSLPGPDIISVGAVVDPDGLYPSNIECSSDAKAATPIKLPKSISKTIAISRDGEVAYCKADGNTVFYDLVSKQIIRQAKGSISDLNDGVFSPDKRYFAGTDTQGLVWLVDLRTGKTKSVGLGRWACFDRKSTRLAWATFPGVESYDPDEVPDGGPGYRGRIVTYNLMNGTHSSIQVPGGYLSGLAFSPDVNSFAYVGYEPNVFARRLMIPTLMVVKKDGSRSAVVRRLDGMDGRFDLLWLPTSK